MIDKKIEDYLERALKIKGVTPDNLIEIAKMIQLEEHREQNIYAVGQTTTSHGMFNVDCGGTGNLPNPNDPKTFIN